MNQRFLIVYEPTLIRFVSDILKIVAVSIYSFVLGKIGQTPSTPLCCTYSEPPRDEESPGGIYNVPYLYKKLSKSRLSDPFFLAMFGHF